ncbi:MAG: phosphoribosyl-ATP diphosphatase [Anaerolineae bacterium]|nr:phosphoribosyl-ATP diphosphatase [Anaerolineae bacterium]MCB0226241.1 phosphoribosyl-ATP diphosphatase [Anaerolineae bacterium]
MNDFITELTTLIADRKANPKPGSYTNKLLADKNKAAQKVGEEATEVIIAALAQSDERVIEEMADLIYHSLVLLETRDLSWSDVVAALEKRHR